MNENLVTTNYLCNYYKVCRVTVSRWMKSGCPYIKKGRNVYFIMSDVEKWIGNKYEVKKINYENKEKAVN